jgi:hypothetical protein
MPRKSSGSVLSQAEIAKLEGRRYYQKGTSQTGTNDFICVDGEGVTNKMADGVIDHRYVLYGVGDEQIENPNGLSYQEILEFTLHCFKKMGTKNTAYCGFFLGYDFNQWLKTAPFRKVERLITREGREARRSKSEKLHGIILPVDFPNGWQLNMLGMRRMEIRKRTCRCDIHYCKHKKSPYVYICDAGPFFQTSFLNTIDPKKWLNPVVSDEEFETIKEGKEGRSAATCITDEMRYYNRLENNVLARVMRALNDGFKEMHIRLTPREWFGPGQAAQKWMKKEKLPRAFDLLQSIKPYVTENALKTYYGGWFEIMMHGIIPGITHEYDINSAYPDIISKLPCITEGHGFWPRNIGEPEIKNHPYTMVRAKVSCFKEYRPEDIGNARTLRETGQNCIGTMLHRDTKKRIHRPDTSEGWFWLHEINAAIRAGFITDVVFYEWIRYDQMCDCPPPMRGVAELYKLRLKHDKRSAMGMGCKLAYNSMYGKFAQSVGHPLFANPFYASLITAGCRTKITNAIATHPNGMWDVVFVATDAVCFLTEHPGLELSNKLGDWEHKTHEDLAVFKPGVYWDNKNRIAIAEGKKAAFKARGIKATDFACRLEEIDEQFLQWHDGNFPAPVFTDGQIEGWPYVEFISNFSMITCLQAIRRNKWYLAGLVFNNMVFYQNSNPIDKRIGMFPERSNDDRPIIRTMPWSLHNGEYDTLPYQRRMGLDDPYEDPWSLERMEAFGVSPDGYIPDIISDALRTE